MQHRRSDASNTRNQLPPLAPRGSQTLNATPSQESDSRTGGNPSVRPGRLSHRSRAGCWTCRKRKVKCDEIHPRCGPCTRLSKECDWEFRWKFDDVTTNTQNKYVNVSTTGNAVWDPQAPRNHARSSPTPSYDDLPSFSELTNDEDRERKAELQMPGTYNVIVNPGSFSNLPEYGVTGTRARGASMNSGRSSFDSHSSSSEASRGRTAVDDPNIVVLTKFEDVSMSLPNIQAFSPNRRTSLPENMHRLEITISPRGSSLPSSRGDFGGNSARDERLMVHYKGFIAKRIMPLGKHFHLDTGAGREDPIVAEARNFPPLHHAICAISLLSLALKGQQQLLAESFQHYHQAIATSILSPSDLHSDRLLYLHFLLLVYDVCFGIQNLDGPNDGVNVNMWIQHIQHLLQIALHRQGHSTGDLQSYILWYVLSLDMNSSLVGSGSGGFVAAYLNNEINMADWRYIPVSKPGEQMHPNEDPSVYRAIYDFSSQVCKQCARISQLAISIRSGFSPQDFHGQNSPRRAARHAQIQVCANELYEIWNSKYPAFLPRAIAQAAAHLPHHARIVFEHATLQFHTAIIYLHTSMYPGQQLDNNNTIRTEVEHSCSNILSMATATVESQNFDQHHIVFPIFLVGFAAPDAGTKNLAVNLMRSMEGTGISRNATRSQELLLAVHNEQQCRVMAGGRSEEVDWISFAKSRGMGLVNFGL